MLRQQPMTTVRSMLVEESRIFQISTFSTLHLHQSELDQSEVLLDVMIPGRTVLLGCCGLGRHKAAHGLRDAELRHP
jgi:hypothetical protein